MLINDIVTYLFTLHDYEPHQSLSLVLTRQLQNTVLNMLNITAVIDNLRRRRAAL